MSFIFTIKYSVVIVYFYLNKLDPFIAVNFHYSLEQYSQTVILLHVTCDNKRDRTEHFKKGRRTFGIME